jgi:hypothetical protein
MERGGEIVEDDYQWDTGLRRYRVYSLTDVELDAMTNGSWFTRKRIARRIREETVFDGAESDTDRNP